ncbi:MAG: helix-turn-helix domain-containing protein [Clostridia bacterium]|nr:helix-turn-helix domain-containing protein [Clostridia bacterium]
MTFREKLLELRRRDKLTQTALAKAVGVTRQAVYLWEKGLSYPDAAALLALRRLFGVSIDALLDDSIPLPAEREAIPSFVPQTKPEKRFAPEKPKTPSKIVEKTDLPVGTGELEPIAEPTPEPIAERTPLRAKVEPRRVKTGNVFDLFGAFFKKKK